MPLNLCYWKLFCDDIDELFGNKNLFDNGFSGEFVGYFVISKQLFFLFFRAILSISDNANKHGYDKDTQKSTLKPQRYLDQHDDQKNEQV